MNPLISSQSGQFFLLIYCILNLGTFECVGLDFIWREERQRCKLLKLHIPESFGSIHSTNNVENQHECSGFGTTKWEVAFHSMLDKLQKEQNDNANPLSNEQQCTALSHKKQRFNEVHMQLEQNYQVLYYTCVLKQKHF